jgi:allantoinase
MAAIRSQRVVLPGGVKPATIQLEGRRIAAIEPYDGTTASIDVGDAIVMPGLVDTHVHINEPGRTEWEGFATATRAAAAGGITTLVDMPLNSIPSTTTVAALQAKREAAAGRCHVDVGFWGGVVPGNVADLEPLARAGVLGFKCFLSPSGVAEFNHVSEWDLRQAMPVLAKLDLPLLVHAEWPGLLSEPNPSDDPRSYATWLTSRPPEAEAAAIDLLIRLSKHTGARVHIVHLASADAVASIAEARAAGVRVSIETCPHYLAFAAEDVADGNTALKCAPPIREARHRDGLWGALADGVIDLVATDHSPAPASLKHRDDGNFVEAWGGIASLQLSLPVMWTAAQQRGIGIERLVEWMSAAPARLAGLADLKGAIAVGRHADIVVFDPDREFEVDASRLYHRHPVTPYDGLRLRGKVLMTFLAGGLIVDGHGEVREGYGRLLSRHQDERDYHARP